MIFLFMPWEPLKQLSYTVQLAFPPRTKSLEDQVYHHVTSLKRLKGLLTINEKLYRGELFCLASCLHLSECRL
jgi:hypothetical protein